MHIILSLVFIAILSFEMVGTFNICPRNVDLIVILAPRSHTLVKQLRGWTEFRQPTQFPLLLFHNPLLQGFHIYRFGLAQSLRLLPAKSSQHQTHHLVVLEEGEAGVEIVVMIGVEQKRFWVGLIEFGRFERVGFVRHGNFWWCRNTIHGCG